MSSLRIKMRFIVGLEEGSSVGVGVGVVDSVSCEINHFQGGLHCFPLSVRMRDYCVAVTREANSLPVFLPR